MVDTLRQCRDEDAVYGQVFHLLANGSDGEDVDMMPLRFGGFEEDSHRSDGLHPFSGFGAHWASSFGCRDLKCLSDALGGASCEIGSK